jgi:DNA-binding PadR family transcriptional regulator
MSDFTDPRLVRGMDPRRGGRPGWGGGFGGRGQARVRRGDVQAAVLALLAEEDMHGYQIIQELADRSGGLWRPGAGSIYPTLRQLQEQGLIRSRNEGSKRVFSITDYGRRAVADSGESEPWKQFAEAEGARVRLRQATEGLLSALAQVEAAGSDPQAEQATAIVSAARKSIYLMLAEEDA